MLNLTKFVFVCVKCLYAYKSQLDEQAAMYLCVV